MVFALARTVLAARFARAAVVEVRLRLELVAIGMGMVVFGFMGAVAVSWKMSESMGWERGSSRCAIEKPPGRPEMKRFRCKLRRIAAGVVHFACGRTEAGWAK
jgi:hypothetical protein